jgi:hypothetical protein
LHKITDKIRQGKNRKKSSGLLAIRTIKQKDAVLFHSNIFVHFCPRSLNVTGIETVFYGQRSPRLGLAQEQQIIQILPEM